MPALKLFFLGSPRFERDGQLVEPASSKAVALLGYLALAGTPQPRDRLQAWLWPDSSGEAARKNLRNTLWAVRRSLGDDAFRSADDRLAIPEFVWIDVRDFEQAGRPSLSNHRERLKLYRGPFLDGLSLADAPEFEIWLTAQRERLAQHYLRLQTGLIEASLQSGDWPEVIDLARQALVHDNLQEPLYRMLMEAHARLGERAEALRLYDALHATLAQELGVEPLAETLALRAAIVRGELSELPPEAAGREAPRIQSRPIRLQAEGRLPSAAEPIRAPFVGRQAERAALDEEAALAAGRQTRVVLLAGELGIGKSRLWREWSAGLPAEQVVVEARCLESTRALPFAPLAELLSQKRYARRLFAPGSPVPEIWLAEVARLLPEIRVTRPDLPAPVALPPDDERRRVLEACGQCLRALAGKPLVLFVDDLHWADHATLDWLDFLLSHGAEQALLLVGTYRPEDAPAALAQLTADWSRAGLVRRLPLARFTQSEASELIGALVPDPGQREKLVDQGLAQSAGNPFYLVELCRAAAAGSPPGAKLAVPAVLTELIRARLSRLPEAAQQILQAAAVLEPDFDFAILRRASGRGEEETLDALDALLAAAVISEQGGAYTFSHPLVAAVVRDGLSGARRAFLHRRAAEALMAAYPGRGPQVAGRLAAHFAQAGEPTRAAEHAGAAGQHALAVAAPAEAVNFYRQALALDPTPERELALGRALYRKGDLTEARTILQSALLRFEALGDRAGAAQTCLTLYDTYLRAGQVDEVVGWAERAQGHVEAGADPAAQAFTYHLLGAALLHARRPLAEAEHYLRQAGRLAAEHKLPEIAARSRFGMGGLLAQRGDLEGAVEAYQAAIELAREAGDHFHEVLGHNNAAYHALLLGRLPAAREHIEAGLALAGARALSVAYQWLFSTRGELALAEREWSEAEIWFQRGLAEAERLGNPEMLANYRANLGLAARGRGDLDGALIRLEAARASAPTPHLQTQIDLWLVELHEQRGEPMAAREALRRAEAHLAGEERGRLRAWADRLRAGL